MQQNKKGAVMSVLTAILLTVVVLAALLAILNTTTDTLDRSVKNSMCKISVKFRSGSIIGGANVFDKELNCPTIQRTATSETINKVIAEELKDCWNKIGSGKADIISSYSLGIAETKTACLICSQISPKDKEGKIIVDPQKLKTYLNSIEVDGKKGLLGTLTGTGQTLDYEYNQPQEVTRAKPVTIAYFIYKSNSNPSKNNPLGTPGGDLSAAPLGTIIGASAGVIGAKAALLFGASGPVGLIIGVGVVGVAEVVNAVGYKQNTYQGLLIGTGSNVAQRCDYQL